MDLGCYAASSRSPCARRAGGRRDGASHAPIGQPEDRSDSGLDHGHEELPDVGYGKAAWHWRTTAERGLSWLAFCAQVARLPRGTLWRHNEAGDLPGVGDDLDRRALAALVSANRGRRGFTFTHKPLRKVADRRAVASANADGFRINLSANDLRHADRLAALGIAPVVVILPSETRRATVTPAGRKVVVCPAVTSGLTCETCGLCAKDRKAVIGFPAHGQAAALVSLRRKDPR